MDTWNKSNGFWKRKPNVKKKMGKAETTIVAASTLLKE